METVWFGIKLGFGVGIALAALYLIIRQVRVYLLDLRFIRAGCTYQKGERPGTPTGWLTRDPYIDDWLLWDETHRVCLRMADSSAALHWDEAHLRAWAASRSVPVDPSLRQRMQEDSCQWNISNYSLEQFLALARGYEGAIKAERTSETSSQQDAATAARQTVPGKPHAQQGLMDLTGSPGGTYKWALVYGWFVMAAAAYLLFAGGVSLLGRQDLTPSAAPLHSQHPMGAVGALFQGILWLAAGLAILQRKLIAIRLIWAVVILAGVGVLFRGIAPLDLLVWLLSAGMAKWFSSKRPFLSK